MRQIATLISLLFFLLAGVVNTKAQEWTWFKGSTTADRQGIYGTLGSPAPTNAPGARRRSVSWTDSNDDLCLFGGLGFDAGALIGRTNDLWKYERATNQWVWLGGSQNRNQIGVYGTPGVPSATNIPSTRDGATEWIDSDDNMWLFGGYGYASTSSYGMLNDLWRYNPGTGEWTWMAGSNLHDEEGTYGTLGVPSATNIPGAREYASSWVDADGDFWLFGGLGFDKNGSYGILNDLWKYNPTTSEWTWVKGVDLVNQDGVYGTKGVSNATNNPGGRYGHNCWVDDNGDFWLFGGIGYDGSSLFGRLNDMWKYDPLTNEWVWMTGVNGVNRSAVYSGMGTFHPLNTPGGRQDAIHWYGKDGSLWMMGGYGHAFGSNFGRLNDLWKYDPATNLWAWFGGTTAANQVGTYGTQTVPSVSNVPGTRESPVGWTDSNGDFWLLGGYGYPSNTSYGYLNDLWRYQPNYAPEYTLIPSDTTSCEGADSVIVNFEISDPDGDPLTFTGTSTNTTLVQNTGLSVNGLGGNTYELKCVIEAGQSGSTTISLEADDGNGGTDQFSFLLTINASATTNLSVSICDGDSHFAGGAAQTSSGIYHDTLTTVSGCDSIVITSLTVHPTYTTSNSVSICDGDSLLVGGGWQSAAGTYTDSLTTVVGCDSVIQTTITIINIPVTNISTAICDGDSYFAGGAFQTVAGIYRDTLTSAQGCDSVVVTTLGILPVYGDTIYVSICDGDGYFAGGAPQTAPGYYYDTLTNASGCDSIIVTKLTVHPITTTTINNNICAGDSLFAGGAWQTTTGTYYDILTSIYGCDSIIETNLTVHPIFVQSQNAGICVGDSFFVGGSWQSTAGTYTDSLVTMAGCDSVIITNLMVHPIYTDTQHVNICDGDIYYAGGGWQSTAGAYTDNFNTIYGCDSILTTILSVHPVKVSFHNVDICDGDSIWLQGSWRMTTGTYYDTLVTTVGCDSIISTNLLVHPTYQSNQSVTICSGDSFFVGGAMQTTAGTYYDTLSSVLSCDSVLITQLTIAPAYIVLEDTSICNGESYFVGGAMQTSSGIYTDTLFTTLGCDSIIVTALTVFPVYDDTSDISICAGDSLYAGGDWQNTAGTYTDSLTTWQGCDSVATTRLNILPVFSTNLNVEICDGNSYFAGGALQTVSGIYHDTLTAVTGCDSLIITDLLVNPYYNVFANVFVCSGDSLFVGGGWQNTAGTYTDTLSTTEGCDSIVTTNLGILPAYSQTNNAAICAGDSLFAGGSWQTASGTYVDMLLTGGGCDSLVTTVLTVHPIQADTFRMEICTGDSLFIGGSWQTTSGIYADTLMALTGCDSLRWIDLVLRPDYYLPQSLSGCVGDSFLLAGSWQMTSGLYYDTLNTVYGCDSIIATNLTISPATYEAIEVTICHSDSLWVGGSWQTTSGIYLDTLTGSSGCDSILSTSLTVRPDWVTTQDIDICEGQSYSFNGNQYGASGVYYDTLTAQDGCDSTIATHLMVHPAPTIDLADFEEDSVCVHEQEVQLPDANPGGGIYTGFVNGQSTFVPELAGTGEHVIYYHFVDAWGCAGVDSTKIIVVDCTDSTGFEFEFDRVPDIVAYPNPSPGIFTLEIASIHSDFFRLLITDAHGRVLYREEVDNVDGLSFAQRQIDLSRYSEGIYFVQLFADFGVITKKVKVIKE